jgi:hypothetical protein
MKDPGIGYYITGLTGMGQQFSMGIWTIDDDDKRRLTAFTLYSQIEG